MNRIPHISLASIVRRLHNSAVSWASIVTIIRGLGFLCVMSYALHRLTSEAIGVWNLGFTAASLRKNKPSFAIA